MESRKAWQKLEKLNIVLEKNNLLDNELRNNIFDLEDYLKICERNENKSYIIYLRT